MYTAEVIADSISDVGHRITTLKVIYPHAVHKDLLRHRCMNRNVESFRAQHPEAIIANLKAGYGFKPDVFASRIAGMGQGEELAEQETANRLWNAHVKHSTMIAEGFLELGIAKQQVNFLLQDLCPLTEIVTATDWSNFYALRCETKADGSPVARPEVYKTAVAIRDAIGGSSPVILRPGEMHLPMLTSKELDQLYKAIDPWQEQIYPVGPEGYWVYVSAGRCARISFGDYRWWEEVPEKSYTRAERLIQAGHMSPFEQQAKPFSENRWQLIRHLQYKIRDNYFMSQTEIDEMVRQLEYSGNLHGFVPARKNFKFEYDYGLISKL